MQATIAQTFDVSRVEVAREPLQEVPYREVVEKIAAARIESCPSRLHTKLVPCAYHGFVRCVEAAFNDHRPLSLSPDHIWLLICQGLAMHINANAKSLRQRLVPFEGKQKITVRRDDFTKGAMENPWEEVLPVFADQLRAYLGSITEVFIPGFTTTSIVEATACHITLMDAVQSYFDYEFITSCGIPRITLEGTPEDWQAIRQRAGHLAQFDCEWWTKHLLPVLDQFAATAKGQVDQPWWQSFFKQNDNSGGPYITGHIINLFPYVVSTQVSYSGSRNEQKTINRTMTRNPLLGKQPPMTERELQRNMVGLTSDTLPSGLSKAPFVWKHLDERLDMEFVSGFVGIRQDEHTLTIRPEIGWAVKANNSLQTPAAKRPLSIWKLWQLGKGR